MISNEIAPGLARAVNFTERFVDGLALVEQGSLFAAGDVGGALDDNPVLCTGDGASCRLRLTPGLT